MGSTELQQGAGPAAGQPLLGASREEPLDMDCGFDMGLRSAGEMVSKGSLEELRCAL